MNDRANTPHEPAPLAARSRTERLSLLLLVLAIAAYVGARAMHLICGCMDGDEIFSVSIVRNDWSRLWRLAAADSVHPPLFYFVLKTWIGWFGESLLAARLLPALIGVLTLVPWYLLCRELGLRRIETATSIAIGAIHPVLIYYSQHVRMYSLLALTALFSLWLFVRLLGPRPRRWSALAVLTLVNIVMVYSHYYGWLVLAIECGYALLVKRRLFWPLLASAALTFAAFLPWLQAAAAAAAAKGGLQVNLWWLPRPGVLQVLWYLAELTGSAEANPIYMRGVLAFGYLIVLMLARSVWSRWDNRGSLFLLFIVATAPAAATAIASNLLPQSIWGQRHLIFAVPAFAILAAVSILRFQPRSGRIAALVFLALWSAFAIRRHINGHDRKMAWDSLVIEMLAREDGAGRPIGFYSLDPHLHYPVRFYLEALRTRRYEFFAARLPEGAELERIVGLAGAVTVRRMQEVPPIGEAHAWVAYIESRWNQSRAPAEILEDRGCIVGRLLKFGDRYHKVRVLPVSCGGRSPGPLAALAGSPR